MANSTYFDATNQVLELAQLDPIADKNTFDNLVLTKYQQAAKSFLMLSNQILGLRVVRHFSKRRFTIILQQGQTDYPLDTGISSENISYRTFFNQTASPNDTQNREIYNWKYEEYLNFQPRQSIITQASPQRWILLPIDRVIGVQNVRFYPVPDQAYVVEYQAKLNAQQLQNSGDLILFPPEYEHALWLLAWQFLESDLGEGKEANLLALAQKAAEQVELSAGMPPDVRKAIITMRLPRRHYGRLAYNSPPSVNSSGQIID